MHFFSIRRKLQLAFGIICLVIVIQGVLAYSLVNKIQSSAHEMLSSSSRELELAEIVASHYQWLSNMSLSIYTGDEFTGSLDPTRCSLGLWLSENMESAAGDSDLYVLLQSADQPHRIIHENARLLLERAESEDWDAAQAEELFRTVIKPNSLTTINYLEQVKARQGELSREVESRRLQELHSIIMVILAMAVFSIVIAVFSSVLLIRRLIPPLKVLTHAAEELALGRSDLEISVRSNDEIGVLAHAFRNMQRSAREQAQLAQTVAAKDLTPAITPRSPQDTISIALNQMVLNIREMLSGVRASSKQVAEGAHQMANAAQSLAQGSTEQSATVEELSASLMEISSKVAQNSKAADEAALLSDEIRSYALDGTRQMLQVVQAIEEIETASKSIRKILRVVDDIAFRTNILSLNAAVEAAHVGESGKGFIVVAEQVRRLANKSAETLKDSDDLFTNCMEKVALGVRIATETSASLDKIVAGVIQSSELVNDIAGQSSLQSMAVHQVSEGIELVSGVVQQNTANAEETAATAEQMSAQATLLSAIISQFRLGEESFPDSPFHTSSSTPGGSGTVETETDNRDDKYDTATSFALDGPIDPQV